MLAGGYNSDGSDPTVCGGSLRPAGAEAPKKTTGKELLALKTIE